MSKGTPISSEADGERAVRCVDLSIGFMEKILKEAVRARRVNEPSFFLPEVRWSTIWSYAERAPSLEQSIGSVVFGAARVAGDLVNDREPGRYEPSTPPKDIPVMTLSWDWTPAPTFAGSELDPGERDVLPSGDVLASTIATAHDWFGIESSDLANNGVSGEMSDFVPDAISRTVPDEMGDFVPDAIGCTGCDEMGDAAPQEIGCIALDERAEPPVSNVVEVLHTTHTSTIAYDHRALGPSLATTILVEFEPQKVTPNPPKQDQGPSPSGTERHKGRRFRR